MTTTGRSSCLLRKHQFSAAESVTSSRLAVDGLIVPALALGGALVGLRAAPVDVFVAELWRDFGHETITEEFGEPLDLKREAVGPSNGRAVLLAIDRKAVADQDLIGMTVAEGRLSIFDEVVRERDLSFAALALRQRLC